MLENIETFIFCDETKFYIKNGDVEDEIYYFGLTCKKSQASLIHRLLENIYVKHQLQLKTFHATTAFREKNPRKHLMDDLTDVIINNNVHCFCYKYSKKTLFDLTKILNKFNNDIFNFDRDEFQALFYFITTLNTYLRDISPEILKKEIGMYFDRNVYGVKDIEAFNFSSPDFVLKQMTFTEKSKISLLALPDFFGYIFRKSKISNNKVQAGNNSLETSSLTINSYQNLLKIHRANLFHFIDVKEEIVLEALRITGK